VADESRPNAIVRYFAETRGELGKVTWPTWREVRQLTIIVIAVMIVMGLYLSLADALGSWLITFAV
jgi:preprotein translocase subunit SecE